MSFLGRAAERVARLSIGQAFCIQVCSGAGRLTAGLRACGMQDSFAVDTRVEGAVCPVVSLDLSRADGQKHFLSLLNEPSLVYVHLSPPCGTAVRTTEAGLRDDLHPHGRPSLKGADKVRVNQANRLFEFFARACKVMYMRGILFSIEGPLQSFLWSTAWWREFLADVPIFVTTLHQCMFGHPRKKATLLLHTLPAFLCLQRACDGKHKHEAWAFSKSSAEMSYPWDLAREMSSLVRKQLLDLGCSDTPQRLQHLDNIITGSRALTGVQANKRVLPLVPEFKLRLQVSGCCDPQALDGLVRKQVLAQPWVPPEGAVLSVDMPSVPAGSKLLSISTQGVQPDADSGLDSPAARSPRVPLLPCPALGLKPQGDVIPSGVHVPSCPTSGLVQPDADSGLDSPAARSPRVPLLPCPALGLKPQGDVIPSGVHVPSCPTSGLVQPDAEMGLGEPQGDVVPSSVHVPTCPTSGPNPQGDVVPLGPQGDVVPSSVHVPTCPTSGPNPQGDVVPLGVLSRPPGEDEPACEKLAYETMAQYPSGRLSSEAVYRVLSQTPEVLPARIRGTHTDASHQWFSGAYGHGPMVGVRNSTLCFPWTTALACRYVREKAPWHRFGAVAFTVNLLSEAHVDSHNDASSYNLLLPLTTFSRGGLWVADDNGSDVLHVRGSRRTGTVHSFDNGAICFNPRFLHATERWEGTRAVLVAYTPSGLEKLEAEDNAVLAELGFVWKEPTAAAPARLPVRFSLEFGVRWSPEEFVAEACKAEHPSSFVNLLPAELSVAIKKNFEMSEHSLGQHRTEMIRKWIARANALVPQEELLKKDMSANRQSILASKRLLLFKYLVEEAGHADNELCDDLVKGFDLVGRLPESRVFKKKFRPATMLENDLREGASRARQATLATVGPSDDPIIDDGVLQATLKEVESGVVEGPVDPKSLPPGATLTRRFGVIQGEVDGVPKVRPIDNYRASRVNAAVTQSEQVTVHTLDVVAGMLSAWLAEAKAQGVKTEIAAKTWDLKSAYKQLPLSDAAFDRDSFFVIFDPRIREPAVFKQRALPFGSRASVTAFIRSALGVWTVAVKLLFLVWSVYFDDYLSIARGSEAKHVDLVISVFFRLLGWRVSSDKLLPYATCCKVLGIELDVGNAIRGFCLLKNTQKRRNEIVASLEHVLEKGRIDAATLERLRGRAQFASGQLFGRLARQALHCLSDRPNKDFSVSGRFRWGAEYLVELLKSEHSRVVSRDLGENRLVFVDASFEPDGYSGLGGICYDAQCKILSWFSAPVPNDLLKILKNCFGTVRETVIYELEALAVVVALELFKKHLCRRNVVVYTDNSGVHGTFVKCWSENVAGGALAFMAAKLEFDLQAFFYYDRVPSYSNPADAPSRGILHQDVCLRAECTADVLVEALKCALRE